MNEQIKRIEKRLDRIEQLVGNHLTEVGKKITKMSTDISWLKKFFWIVMTASIVTIVGAFFMLIIK